jgi:hypothetical protein
MATVDHPVLRAIPICPLCLEHKDVGTLICWPCHRTQKAHNQGGYSAHAIQRLETIAAFLGSAFEAHNKEFGS